MKKNMRILMIFLFSGLLTSGPGVWAKNSPNSSMITDPADFMLTTDDLLSLCEWQQTPIVTRQVADGSLSFTEIFCGTDPAKRRVLQMILITAREFQPGDGNYYISLRDTGKDDALVDVGSWATNLRTMYDQSAIAFSKQNVLVYIADGSGYPQEDIFNLAGKLADRIPDQIVPVIMPSDHASQSVDQAYLEHISVMPPSLTFANMGGDMPTMVRPSNSAIGQLGFSAQFTEPQQVIVEIFPQNSEEYLARWILPQSVQPVYALEKVLNPSPIIDVDYANDLFFAKGTYLAMVTADGKLLYRTEFMIQ